MEVILNSLNDLPEEVQISVCELSVQNQQLKDDIQKLQQENAILKSKVAENNLCRLSPLTRITVDR